MATESVAESLDLLYLTRLTAREDIINNKRRESFHSYIKFLYGEEVYKKIQRLEKLQVKKSKLLCSLVFLKRCRDQDIVPVFAKIRHPITSTKARSIFHRASKSLVKERIDFTYLELDKTSGEAFNLSLWILNRLDPSDINWIYTSISAQAQITAQKMATKQIKKFEKLSPKTCTEYFSNDRLVVNLSSRSLDDASISVLKKGLNYAPAPRTIPFKDIISGVEGAIKSLQVEDADEIRGEVSHALKRSRQPKTNLSAAESRALYNLRKDNDIVILPADKGNASVVMDSVTYHTKITTLLSDPAYERISKDPMNKIKRSTSSLLKTSGLSTDKIKVLTPHSALMPRLYGLPKIHKEHTPLRPIVSSIGSPTYQLAKYLTGLLQPFVGGCEHHVRNSAQFVRCLKQIKLNTTDLLVSFDVESLFTRVPLEDSLRLLGEHFAPGLVKLFQHVLTTTYFKYNGIVYRQTDGVAMGSPLSPAIANFYMEDFEHRALASAQYKPSHFFRYVDDTFVIWPHGNQQLGEFLRHLNNQHPNIKFTMEVEVDGKLPFLDLEIIRKSDGSLGHRVYRKPTHTDLYLNANSYHHPSQKQAVLATLFHRAFTVSDEEHLGQEVKHLYKVLQQNEYNYREISKIHRRVEQHYNKNAEQHNDVDSDNISRAFIPYCGNVSNRIGRILKKHKIKSIYLPPAKIRQKLRPIKDDLGLNTPGVYKIPCECGLVYIGQTGRTIEERRKEHQRHLRLLYPEKSAVAEHSLEQQHRILFEDTTALHRTSRYNDRLIKEAIEIRLHPENYNRDSGQQLNPAWKPLFTHIQRRGTYSRHMERDTGLPSGPARDVSS